MGRLWNRNHKKLRVIKISLIRQLICLSSLKHMFFAEQVISHRFFEFVLPRIMKTCFCQGISKMHLSEPNLHGILKCDFLSDFGMWFAVRS